MYNFIVELETKFYEVSRKIKTLVSVLTIETFMFIKCIYFHCLFYSGHYKK